MDPPDKMNMIVLNPRAGADRDRTAAVKVTKEIPFHRNALMSPEMIHPLEHFNKGSVSSPADDGDSALCRRRDHPGERQRTLQIHSQAFCSCPCDNHSVPG